jgi:hypothetical protein
MGLPTLEAGLRQDSVAVDFAVTVVVGDSQEVSEVVVEVLPHLWPLELILIRVRRLSLSLQLSCSM